MINHGNICDFSFYVRAFDTKEHYRNYGQPATELSLQQAMSEFEKHCADNPVHVNTVLGVNFTTKRRDLEPAGVGAADLMQCVNGRLKLSEDYKLSEALSRESLIAVNTVEMLERERGRLQRVSDNATAKCARLISDNISGLDSPDKISTFMGEMAEEFGTERCKAVLANALHGQESAEGRSDLTDYLENSFSGEYDKRFNVFANTEQIFGLAEALREYDLSEIESKLVRAGLVNGDDKHGIRDKANAVAGEIERHNDLEDSGAVADDQLEL